MKAITAAEKQAIAAFRAYHGRCWRSALSCAWSRSLYTGVTSDQASVLQHLRNTHGPECLKWFDGAAGGTDSDSHTSKETVVLTVLTVGITVEAFCSFPAGELPSNPDEVLAKAKRLAKEAGRGQHGAFVPEWFLASNLRVEHLMAGDKDILGDIPLDEVDDAGMDEDAIAEFFQQRIEDGDLVLGDIPRLMARYGLKEPSAFMEEMRERMEIERTDWLIEIDAVNGPCWVAAGGDDPSRTCDIQSAECYATRHEALDNAAAFRRSHPERKYRVVRYPCDS